MTWPILSTGIRGWRHMLPRAADCLLTRVRGPPDGRPAPRHLLPHLRLSTDGGDQYGGPTRDARPERLHLG